MDLDLTKLNSMQSRARLEDVPDSSLVFADCGACQRLLAGLANIGEMIFHAGLDPASAGPGACAILFHVRRTRLGCRSFKRQLLTGLGKVLKVCLEAGSDPVCVPKT
jgi:hypothetical protein